MSLKQPKNNSEKAIRISDEVIASITAIAIQDVNGAVGVSLANKLESKNILRSVSTEMKDEGIIVNTDVVVEYGVNIPEVTWEVQRKTKKAIESMTGLTVHRVNVNVRDVMLPDQKKEEEIK